MTDDALKAKLKAHAHERHGVGNVRATLREAVFGVQDGLISTPGALTGIAAGSYLSSKSPLGNALVMGTAPMATAMPVSIVGTLTALFLFGGLKGRIVKQSWWRSGLEMLSVGWILR